jgi:hypothetical protein
LTTIYLRPGRVLVEGHAYPVFYPHSADKIRLGQHVAVIDNLQQGGNCIGFGAVTEVGEHEFTILYQVARYKAPFLPRTK